MNVRRTAAVAAALVVGAALGAPQASSAAAADSLPLDISALRSHDCIHVGVMREGDCSGDLLSAYVAETVPAGGAVTLGGVDFLWPSADVATTDVVVGSGQALSLPRAALKGWRSLAVLTAAKDDAQQKAAFTIHYTDGTKARLSYDAISWKHGRRQSILPDVRTYYAADVASRFAFAGEGAVQLAVLPIDASKTIKRLEMPSSGGGPAILIFSVSMSRLTKAPPLPKA